MKYITYSLLLVACCFILAACLSPASDNLPGDEAINAEEFQQMLEDAELPIEYFSPAGNNLTMGRLIAYTDTMFELEVLTEAFGGIEVNRTLGFLPLSVNAPYAEVTRAAAQHFITAVSDAMTNRADGLKAFYAIASFDQIHMIDDLDIVSVGWSRFDIINGEAVFNLSSRNDNEYHIPAGYNLPIERARNNDVPIYLMIAGHMAHHGGMTTSAYILLDPVMRESALDDLVDAAHNGVISPISGQRIYFDGFSMDFEEMRGEQAREAYSQFIIDLRSRLPDDFGLLICVHPAVPHGPYFDAFDFRVLGENSDGLILMAHDFYAKSLSDEERAMGEVATRTPPSPITAVYYSIYRATHPETGTDPSKVWLAMSFTGVQWQIQNGEVLSNRPMNPTNDLIEARLPYATVTHGASGNPRAVWENDGVENVLFFEDAVSVMQRQRLADLFGLAGISLWRLGNVPDGERVVNMDAWDRLLAWR